MTDVLSHSLTLAPSPWLRRHRMEWRDRNDRPVGRDRDSRRLILPKLKDNKSFKRIELLITKDDIHTLFYIVHLGALCPIEKAGFRLSRRRCAAAESWKAVLPLSLAPPFPNRGAMGQWPLHRCSGGKRIPQGAPANKRNTMDP